MTSRLSFAIGILFGCVTPASGLHASAGALTIRMPQRLTPLPIAMMAKKKSKPRNLLLQTHESTTPSAAPRHHYHGVQEHEQRKRPRRSIPTP